ncbi:MAG: hypothetical protein ACLFUL_12900 [Desulfobacteraceae bacterium]
MVHVTPYTGGQKLEHRLSAAFRNIIACRLLEGARGIKPPPGFADRANGFEARGAPSTIAPTVKTQIRLPLQPQMEGIMKTVMRQQKGTIPFFGPVLRLPNTGNSGDIRSGKADASTA